MPAPRKKTKSVSTSNAATKAKTKGKDQTTTTAPTKRNANANSKGGRGRKRAAQDADVISDDYDDDAIADGGGDAQVINGPSGKATKRSRKEMIDYEEEVEGFQFSRAGTKTTTAADSNSKRAVAPPRGAENIVEENASPEAQPVKKKRGRPKKEKPVAAEPTPMPTPTVTAPPRRISFSSTPKVSLNNQQPADLDDRPARKPEKTTTAKTKPKPKKTASEKQQQQQQQQPPVNPAQSPPSLLPKANGHSHVTRPQPQPQSPVPRTPRDPSPQKISLPFADTPVLRRNKEMRMQNNKKSATGGGGSKQRRSSLGMRGRRASSLIDTGASNALPHDEVPTADLYKHIESEGLPEPRRMRQLLTWCATRALADQSSRKGQPTEDQSAILTARVLQSELVNEFSQRSGMSDWFSREDAQPLAVVVKKPNPKNVQNQEKIRELEEKIQRLQKERESLKSLLQPPSILQIKPFEKGSRGYDRPHLSHPSSSSINSSLLNPSQQQLLNSLTLPAPASSPAQKKPEFSLSAVTSRLAKLTTSITPTLDIFASGIHDIAVFKDAADDAASHVLADCARRMDESDRARRKRIFEAFMNVAHNNNGDNNGAVAELDDEDGEEDLRPVLGALSRIETR